MKRKRLSVEQIVAETPSETNTNPGPLFPSASIRQNANINHEPLSERRLSPLVEAPASLWRDPHSAALPTGLGPPPEGLDLMRTVPRRNASSGFMPFGRRLSSARSGRLISAMALDFMARLECENEPL
jgi:hypothetical protein